CNFLRLGLGGSAGHWGYRGAPELGAGAGAVAGSADVGANAADPVLILRNLHPIEAGTLAGIAEESDPARAGSLIVPRADFFPFDGRGEAVAPHIYGDVVRLIVVDHDVERGLHAVSTLTTRDGVMHQR